MKKSIGLLVSVLIGVLVFSSFASAVFVFMSSSQTINDGDSASFTCTVDPALGTANYEIRLSGNGVNRVLRSGSTSASVEQFDVNIGSGDYNGAGNYDVTCSADEPTCNGQCNDNDQASASLTVTQACDCAGYGVGWFDAPFWGGCSDANHVCSSEGTAYAYCNGCMWDTNWDNHQCVSTYNGPTCNTGARQCSGSNIEVCENGCGFSVVENCDLQDGWYDTSETRTINDVCTSRTEKKQEYRDYSCGGSTIYCEYRVTDTRWIVIRNSNLPDGTVCSYDSGVCEANDICIAGACVKQYAPSTTVCRSANGVCDVPEYCLGSSASCPADAKRPDGTSCSDGQYCNGNEVCIGGTCSGGTPIDCSANNIPGVSTCDYVPDAINYTFDYRSPFTSVCDEASDSCTTGSTTITHACSLTCGAQCVVDADCNDGNPNTVDACTGGCTCTHTGSSYCGDGVVTAPETCELPNTNNNQYCQQSTSACQGNMTGTRDAYGSCGATCGCNFDPFTYTCVKDSCGATCATNSDCQNKCVGSIRHYDASCDLLGSCGCKWALTEDCNTKDGWYDTNETRWVGLSTCNEKLQGKRELRDYSCAPDACSHVVTNITWYDKNQTRPTAEGQSCSDGLFCNGNEVCRAGVCTSGTPVNCAGNSYPGIDRCDNDPDNNPYTRDVSQGFVSVCDEVNDVCTQKNRTFTHTCSDVCGAVCLTNAECDDKDPTTIDTCSGCACVNTKINGTCGDGVVQAPEACELPNTQDNTYCPQSTTVCQGNKTGVRDAHGRCTSTCGCALDTPTSFACVSGTCGATCSNNAQCDDGDNNTIDTCSTTSCGCVHVSIVPVCGNGIVDAGEQCDGNSRACIDNSTGYSGMMACGSDCMWTNICVANPFCGDNICNGDETCSTCSNDCGACPARRSGGGGGGSSARTTSLSDWECSEWSACVEGEQSRSCTQNNLRKSETQACTLEVVENETKPTNTNSVKITSAPVSFTIEASDVAISEVSEETLGETSAGAMLSSAEDGLGGVLAAEKSDSIITGFAAKEAYGDESSGNVKFSLLKVLVAVLVGGVLLHLYYFKKR